MESMANESLIEPAAASSQEGVAPLLPQTAQSTPGAPLAAQDTDLIEDEWVDAVKNVMHTYRNDPHGLAAALSALRRDYLAKRYGRNLKAAE